MISNILDIVRDIAEKENLKTITAVHLRTGKMRQIEPDFMRFAFETVSKGTITENSELVITEVPIKAECNDCNEVFNVKDNNFICEKCSSYNLNIIEGNELIITNIEGED